MNQPGGSWERNSNFSEKSLMWNFAAEENLNREGSYTVFATASMVSFVGTSGLLVFLVN